MLKLIIGFILGYWVAFNKDTVKEYYDKLVAFIKEKYNAIKENKTEE
jgi:hypothetical protein